MKRWLPLLLVCLAVVGIALVLSDYASEQAERIASAPTDKAIPEREAEPDPARERACNRAQIAYDEIWDQSLENPGDPEKEAALGVALGELYEACEVDGEGNVDGTGEGVEADDTGMEEEPN